MIMYKESGVVGHSAQKKKLYTKIEIKMKQRKRAKLLLRRANVTSTS